MSLDTDGRVYNHFFFGAAACCSSRTYLLCFKAVPCTASRAGRLGRGLGLRRSGCHLARWVPVARLIAGAVPSGELFKEKFEK